MKLRRRFRWGWLAVGVGLILDWATWALWIVEDATRAALPIVWWFHGFGSGLLCIGLVQTMARRRQQRNWAMLVLTWAVLFALPAVGVWLVWAALGRLRGLRPASQRPRFGETSVPALERIEPWKAQRRIAAMGSQLVRSAAPLPLQQQVLTLLALRPSAAGNQTLTQLQEDGRHEDIRLLAYGVLDLQQQRLQQWIEQAQTLLAYRAERTQLLTALAELHWELAHQSLAHDDLRQQALRQCLYWLDQLRQQQVELHSHARLLRLRALLALGDMKTASLEIEAMAQKPDPSWLPYMAEWAYEMRRDDLCQRWLAQLTRPSGGDKLLPVHRYWVQA